MAPKAGVIVLSVLGFYFQERPAATHACLLSLTLRQECVMRPTNSGQSPRTKIDYGCRLKQGVIQPLTPRYPSVQSKMTSSQSI